MVRLHLTNAYAAQGRFDEAMKLLTSTPIRACKKPEQTLMEPFRHHQQPVLLRGTDGRP